MSNFTASQARALSVHHLSSKDSIFSKIRKQCDQRIQRATKLYDYIVFLVPGYLFGLPLFDPEPMYLRLYYSLTKRGFHVYNSGRPLELYITWRAPQTKATTTTAKPKSFDRLAQLRQTLQQPTTLVE